MSIYELGEQYRELSEMAASEDISADDLKDTFEAIEGEIAQKIESTAFIMFELKNKVANIAAEISRIQGLKKTAQNELDRVEDLVRFGLSVAPKNRIDTGRLKASLGKPTEKVVIDNVSKLPIDYVKIETVEKPDSAEIKKALKDGIDLDGAAHIEQGKARLTIK